MRDIVREMHRKLSAFLLLFLLSLPFSGEVFASDIIFDFGSSVVVDSSYSAYTSVAALDSTHVIIATGNGVRVGTVTGSTMTLGAETELSNYTVSVAAIDTTHAVIGYVALDESINAVIATISGTTVTLGSPVTLSADGMANFKSVAVAVPDSTHVAIAFYETYPYTEAFTVIGEISGGSISLGAPVSLGEAVYVDITVLDTTHVAVSYQDFDNGLQKVAVGEITGTDVSFGSVESPGSACVDSSIEAIDATHVVIAYCDINSSNQIKLLVGEVSGTSISLGTQFSVGAQGEYFSLAKLDGTHAVFGMQNISLAQLPVAYRLTIDGSDIDISPRVTVMDIVPDITEVTALDSSTIVYALTYGTTYAVVGRERTRPDPVTGLAAAVDDSDVVLNWTNPADPDFASVSIRRSTSGYPETINEGTVVADGLTTTTYTDNDATDAFYFYSVFVLDTSDNPSDAVTATAVVDTAAAAANACLLRAYWPLDTFDASTAPDTSSNGFDAVDLPGGGAPELSDDVPADGPVTNPHSYLFTASETDYLRASLPVTDDFTLCAWVKTTTAGSGNDHWESRAILHAEAGGIADDFGFGMNEDEHLVFGNGNGSSDYTIAGSTVINTGEWVHTCVTRQKSSGHIRLYVNGELDGAGVGSTTSLNDSTYIYIGGANDGGQHWNGNIDDVRIYASVLNAADIRSIADHPASCTSSSSSSSSVSRQGSGGGRRGSPGRGGTAPTLNQSQIPQSLRPAASVRETMSKDIKTRTCDRVMKWFHDDAKMLDRVNARLEKRFGFVCSN